MGGGAGPGVLFSFADELIVDGLGLDELDGLGQVVAIVEDAGVESVVPEFAGAFTAAVVVLSVPKLGAADDLAEGAAFVRGEYEVDAVLHEAVGEDVGFVELGLLGEGGEVLSPVGIGGEQRAAVEAALADVMGGVDNSNSGSSWHSAIIGKALSGTTKKRLILVG